MLYAFVKDPSGNVERIGDVDEASVQAKIDGYVANGFVLAEAAEYDAQVLAGAANTGTETVPKADFDALQARVDAAKAALEPGVEQSGEGTEEGAGE